MNRILIQENGKVELVKEGTKIIPKRKASNEEMLRVVVEYKDENDKLSEIEGLIKSTTSTVEVRKNILKNLEKISKSAARSATIKIEFPTSDTATE